MAVVRQGDKGENVRLVQAALNTFDLSMGGLPAAPLKVDGVYGTKTADAVRNFRALAGLSYSGNVVDEETWRLLGLGGALGGAGVSYSAGGTATRPRTVSGGAGASVPNFNTPGGGTPQPSGASPGAGGITADALTVRIQQSGGAIFVAANSPELAVAAANGFKFDYKPQVDGTYKITLTNYQQYAIIGGAALLLVVLLTRG